MDKFWEWMRNSGYGYYKGSIRNWMLWYYEFHPIPKQMLIGYMMEYLDEVEPHWGFDELDKIGGMTSEGRYVLLEQKIKEVK